MGQALYRKYRSKSLSEIVGQEHITTALSNALKQGRISHAYLFTGPRGVGKTSIARILAYEVNGLPYDEKATHLDIIEIDAASNRRIDEIRELRERVHSAPASAKYKVYIIDEVHMLTKEAFNALLKTLEEPPAHAIFILATTESHKLPETIISRTQRFNFRPVEQRQVVDHLASIAKQENIDVSPDALELIAQHGGGSFRDSISLLDQAGNSDKKVQLADIQRMLGIAPAQAIKDLLVVLQTGRVADLVNLLSTFRDQGYQPAQLSKQFAGQLRDSLINNSLPLSQERITTLLRGLLMVPASHDPATAFELLMIEQVIGNTELITASVPEPKPEITPTEPEPFKKPTEEAVESPKAKHKKTVVKPLKSQPDKASEDARATTLPAPTSLLNDQTWSAVLAEIKNTHNTLYSIARMAQPSLEGNTLTLGFKFPFHQKRINESKNKKLFSDIVFSLTGKKVKIICEKTDNTTIVNFGKPTETPKNNAIDAISNIFGGAEILE